MKWCNMAQESFAWYYVTLGKQSRNVALCYNRQSFVKCIITFELENEHALQHCATTGKQSWNIKSCRPNPKQRCNEEMCYNRQTVVSYNSVLHPANTPSYSYLSVSKMLQHLNPLKFSWNSTISGSGRRRPAFNCYPTKLSSDEKVY